MRAPVARRKADAELGAGVARNEPPGATVLVDGVSAGVTPLEMQLTAGEHDIEVRLSGYNAWSDKVLVSAGIAGSAAGRTARAGRRARRNREHARRGERQRRRRVPRPHAAVAAAHAGPLASTDADEAGLRDVDARAVRRGRQRPQAADRADGAVRRDRGREHARERRGLGGRRAPRRDTRDARAHGREPRHRDPPGGLRERAAELTPRPGFPQKLESTLTALDRIIGRRVTRRCSGRRSAKSSSLSRRVSSRWARRGASRDGARTRCCARCALTQGVLPRRARGDERRVPRVQGRPQLRANSTATR